MRQRGIVGILGSVVAIVIILSVVAFIMFTPWNCEINIISPRYSEVWDELGDYTIIWEASDSIENVKIELYRGNDFILIISSKTINNGQLNFTINESNAEFLSGLNFRVKIADFNNENNYAFSDYFTINIKSDNGNGGGWG